jgi:hypothetical protein
MEASALVVIDIPLQVPRDTRGESRIPLLQAWMRLPWTYAGLDTHYGYAHPVGIVGGTFTSTERIGMFGKRYQRSSPFA